ncbi:MAG TPA: hypothetical protein DFR83_28020 [Deltaproteobacteria bacterium]|nr:hypothetical protein [Deltaproteobacteria bacterium]
MEHSPAENKQPWMQELDMTTDGPDLPAVADPLVQVVLDRVMADGELPKQLDEVHRAWPKSRNRMLLGADALEVCVQLRGVAIQICVPYDQWPSRPPTLTVEAPPIIHPNVGHGGVIHRLNGQQHWNRTVTLADLLRELERRFVEHPPQRRGRWRAWLGRAAQMVWYRNPE